MNYGMTTVGIVVVVAPVLLSHLLLGPVAPADLQVFVHSANPSTNRCESEIPSKDYVMTPLGLCSGLHSASPKYCVSDEIPVNILLFLCKIGDYNNRSVINLLMQDYNWQADMLRNFIV